ncbi:hypothetical protein MPTK1_4g07920 [Marchantia polymorpha subsp. ruderalis]|uniref:Protein kinase domain-containing protein n=2 Tax=Marchantia polymorpha TaxID=3197 RepID=A0AAF6B7K9_MARPO|nr:hypothetical protein MARPO_0120s0050 [Marchantia polymorpha]BBN07993.1 hypothetical protein Mp_4g07920 [Marchantia polymorpha subsp. ruderalis]|eukprot:PTQ30778.1 hypothetical protein MARPO_0120s0050 [Marchantia polymorpha]
MSTANSSTKRSEMRWGSPRLVASIFLFLSLQLTETWNGEALLAPEDGNAIEELRVAFNLTEFANGDPCSNNTDNWITCSNSTKSARVLTIGLKNLNLTGTLPQALTRLRFLREVNLGYNKFRGVVPDLRNLTHLEILDLSENNFTGPIPNTTFFPNITQLILSGCNFTGGIPPSLFKNKNLQKLRLDNSPLRGPVPNLNGISNIKELYLGQTQLVGRIPRSLENLTRATHFEIKTNPGITGPLPDLNKMPSVQYWDSSQCGLSGRLPELKNALSLKGLQLWNNNFSGSIPPLLFKHVDLQWLNLYGNPLLTGEIPDVSGLESVEVFSAYDCDLTGPLPSFQNTTKLRFLNLWNNRLTEFASDLRNLSTLCIVDVRNNSIKGTLPDLPPSSIQEKTPDHFVQKLKFSNNSFSGEIPLSWNNLTWLEEITVNTNNLSGELRSEMIGNMRNLRILDVRSNNFSGTIPKEIGDLNDLYFLDLRNNGFTGDVPESLLFLPNLTQVLLDNNNFKTLPKSLITRFGLNITYSNNPNLILIPEEDKKGVPPGAIVGIVAGVCAVLAVTLLLLCLYRRKKNGNSFATDQIPKTATGFTWKEIKSMTSDNKTLIGKGGFGAVYYGKLMDGEEVAVKIRSADSKQGSAEFLNEVRLLCKLHHRNLVRLIGYCLEGREQVLVYDYMSQGSLANHLYPSDSSEATTDASTTVPRKTQDLDWRTRLEIAVDAARGIEYLHKDCDPPIIHRDMKSSNILLGDKLQAKIADLGISKQVPDSYDPDQVGSTMNGVSTAIKGTFGYLDPEYFARRKLTTKSDVYSFGVVLLEIVTGKRPFTLDFPGSEDTNLIDWVKNAVDMGVIDSVVDRRLKGGYSPEGMEKVIVCALAAVNPSGGERPDMAQIINTLNEALLFEGRSIYTVKKVYHMEKTDPAVMDDMRVESMDHSHVSFPNHSRGSTT